MEQSNQLKEVKLVFPDYKAESFDLADATISEVNIYKKTGIMELLLNTKNLISIKELQGFKKYIVNRFNIKDVSFKINSAMELDKKSKFIENDWTNMIGYLSQKIPLIKAFIKNSNASINDKNIEIELGVKGKNLLEGQGINSKISEFIQNIYDTKYVIKFNDDDASKYEKNMQDLNNKIIEDYSRTCIQTLMNQKSKRKQNNEN